jgi:hypothetical protein
MEDINTKSVRYPVATDIKLDKIALKLGRTKKHDRHTNGRVFPPEQERPLRPE